MVLHFCFGFNLGALKRVLARPPNMPVQRAIFRPASGIVQPNAVQVKPSRTQKVEGGLHGS